MKEHVILLIAAVAVIVWSLHECYRYFAPSLHGEFLRYSRARIARRMSVSLITLVVLTMIGVRNLVDPWLPSALMLAYYGVCMALAVFLVFLALGDLAETSHQLQTARKTLVEQSLMQLAADIKKQKAAEPAGRPGKGGEDSRKSDDSGV